MTAAARPGQIVVVGSTMIDLVAYTSRIPGPGETLVGDRFAMGFGGKGANQAVMARLLGAPVAMVNCVGDDGYGTMTRENLASFGIDITDVHVAPGASGVAPIWVEPDGTNRIIIIPGANHLLTATQATAAIDRGPAPAVVLGQFEIPQSVTAAAFAAARKRGAVTILNPAPGAAVDPDLLAASDWVIPNQVELGQLIPGATAQDDADLVAAADRLGSGLVVTLGEAGAAMVDLSRAVHRVPAPPVAAVDTTGAGDAFVGAFAFAVAAGMDPVVAMRLGVLCGADSVTRPGTQTSFPRGAAIRHLVEAATNPQLEV